jgi:hypothetical protein
MYDADYFFVPNPINRYYSISPRRNLKSNNNAPALVTAAANAASMSEPSE